MKRSLYIISLAVFVFALWSLYRIVTTSAPDFSVYYVSAKNLLSGTNIYTAKNVFTGLGYPPFTLLFFIPLLLLPYTGAQTLWVVFSFLALFGSIWVCLRFLHKATPDNVLLVFIVAFLSFPTRFTLGMGQSNLIALFFLVLSLYFLSSKNEKGSITSLVILLILKPHLSVLLPIFLIHKKYSFLFFVGLSLCLLIAITGVLFGWQNYQTYITDMIPRLSVFNGREIYFNQGFSAFATRAFVYPISVWINSIASIGLVLWTIWYVFIKNVPLVESLIVFLPVYLMIEPLSWQHHYVFLLPVYMWLWFKAKHTKGLIFLFLISIVLVSINIKSSMSLIGFPFHEVILSHVFIGTLFVYICYIFNVKKTFK
jgi:hypothetical protein